MTAHPAMSSSPLIGARHRTSSPAPEPVAVLECAQAPDRGFIARIWDAYCARRNAARMRNMAEDMEPHMLSDVGAPQWLVNEANVRREFARLRSVDYIRW